MHPIRAIDGWILGQCTKFAHWFQRLTGRTNFFLAKNCRALCFMAVALQITNHFGKLYKGDETVMVVLFGPLILLQIMWEGWQCDKAEDHVLSGHQTLPAYARSMGTIAEWRIFIILWALSVFFLLHSDGRFAVLQYIDNHAFPLGASGFYYFAAVTPLPPGKSKVREWIESFGHRLVPVKVNQ